MTTRLVRGFAAVREVLLATTEAAPGVWLAIIRDPAGVKFALSHCD